VDNYNRRRFFASWIWVPVREPASTNGLFPSSIRDAGVAPKIQNPGDPGSGTATREAIKTTEIEKSE